LFGCFHTAALIVIVIITLSLHASVERLCRMLAHHMQFDG
jgi:hypothetical protein